MKQKRLMRKISTLAVLTAVFFSQFALLTPRAAYAQWSVLNPDIIAQNIQENLSESISSNIEKAWVASTASMLVNVMMAAANYRTYEAVLNVATGGPGDSPLFTSLPADEYMQYVGANVIFEAYKGIDSADSVMSLFGVRVPDDPTFLAIVRSGLQDTGSGEVGEFDYREIISNWDSYLVSVYDSDDSPEVRTENILKSLSMSFDQNEYRAGLDIYAQTLLESQAQAELARQGYTENAGFIDKVDPITGNVLIPAAEIRKQFEDALASIQELPTQIGLASLGDQNVLLQLGVYAGSIFTQTLGSQLMEEIFSSGLSDSLDFDPFNPNARSGLTRERAAEQYKSILSFRPVQISDYDLLSRLSSCPAQYLGNSPQLYSCAIDTSFAAAVARADAGIPMTLQEAIEEGYIDANWPLIPSSDTARNQDANCYAYGFCYSNLVKLRKARIIPVGWEMAANAPENSASSPVTLGEVMAGFNDCDENGERTSEHPWCHLIDPNWVLKYPQSQCRTLGYGQLLSARGATDRAEECVDVQSCISENEDGTCDGGYGYCVKEKNVWEFRGDSCPEQYASCLSFSTSDGEPVDYLTSTVDYGNCGEDSAGCLWYATQKYDNGTGTLDWPAIGNLEFSSQSPLAYKNRLYVNNEVDPCTEDQAGCQELLVRDEGLALNLVRNGSFEADNDNNTWPDVWLAGSYSAADYSNDETVSRAGASAVSPSGTSVYQHGLMLDQRQLYTYSFYAARRSAGAGSAVSYVVLRDENNFEGVDLTGFSIVGDCSPVAYDSLPGVDALRTVAAPTSQEFERFECTFTTPSLTDRTSQLAAEIIFESGNVWIDDVQLEQNEEASIYHPGYNEGYSSIQTISAQLPPDYLGCTGASTDPAACANYAQICSENDRGCEQYSPVNGDVDVTGIVNEFDVCPSICVGYDTYKQEPTRYEPDGAFPLYFIPDTADTCSESAVGCDEFTNLSTEAREYFTYLRACLTEDQAAVNTNGDNASIFYTWEGSDIEGFQLKSWELLESDLGNAPCTNWSATANGITCDDSNGEYAFGAPEECNEHSDIFVNPDCREFYDEDGSIFYRPWSETVTVNDACTTYRKTDVVGLGTDADGNGFDDGAENCQQSGGYFDGVTSECRYFGYEEESETCSESENGCRKYTGGSSGNSRVAMEEVFEAGTLSNWDAVNAADVTLSNDSVASGGHSLASDGLTVWTHLYSSGAPCESAGGCPSSTGTLGGNCVVFEGNAYCGTLHNELFAGKTYTLTFWAKGSGSITAGFDIEANPGSVSIDVPFSSSIPLTSEWKRYSVGPLNMQESQYPTFGDGTVLAFAPANGGVLFNIDNITLREGESDLTLLKDSWVTPAQCDMNLQGQASPQYHLGCQEYADRGGRTAYLKSVSRLCSSDVVGCSAYFTTAQTDNPSAQIYNATCANVDTDGDGTPELATQKTACYLETNAAGDSFNTDTTKLCDILTGERDCLFDLDYYLPEIVFEDARFSHLSYGPETEWVKADRAVYAVVGDEDLCSEQFAGCQEVGAFTLTPDQTAVESWTTTYLMNDPDQYDQILCADDQLFCEAFNAGSEGVWYFKDPQGRTCEYRTDVVIGGNTYDGWFREGSDEFCYGTGTCSNTGTSCAEDSECRLGVCSADPTLDCYADFDCPGTQTCLNDSTATCDITSGAYIIGGELSGIWQNGDNAYTGWVGMCSSEYNGCSEFRDVLDFASDEFYGETNGESYFFIDNNNLDENTLLSSQKCNGLVSQELGCVLFHDTAEPGLDYNASASYIASRHADELFGDAQFDLVKPITCNLGSNASTITKIDGSTVDLCANRCTYPKSRMLTPAEYAASSFTTADEEYLYGGSCYDDSDCAAYESDIGEMVEGSCANVVTSEVGSAPAPVPRLSNDSNRVLKVNRDRECSEWLTCSSSQTVWDEESSSYRTVCNEIDLCTEYSNSGDASFCSEWNPDDPALVLDLENYSARDITWYGEEFSGYAIPDLFPTQYLTQVNVAPPGTCEGLVITGSAGDKQPNFTLHNRTGDVCETDDDCTSANQTCIPNTEKDYRLAFEAGSCSDAADFGGDCTVGYCADTGAACTASSDCIGSACITGQCVDVNGEFLGFSCGLDFSCPVGSCNVSVATKQGSCYYGVCALSPEGNRLNDETAEVSTCRAYPEVDSPFGNEVVESWIDAEKLLDPTEGNPTPSSSMGVRSLPYNTKAGFENANLCAPGEDCVCTYKKISTSVGVKTYISAETALSDIAKDEALGGEEGGRLGICSGGDADGALCVKDEDCNGIEAQDDKTVEVALGKCYPIVREDTIIGLEGFCLERDSGININGDPNLGACFTWFPVDQLAGATDLFAKYKEAGYFDEGVEYCSYVAPYVNIYPSLARAGGDTDTDWKDGEANIACAEQVGNSGSVFQRCAEDNEDFMCPPGHYALMGAFYSSGNDDTFARFCQSPPSSVIDGSDGDKDCPFVCVPIEAETEEGQDCFDTFVEGSGYDETYTRAVTDSGYDWDTDIYFYKSGNYKEFDNTAIAVQQCVAKGVEVNRDLVGTSVLAHTSGMDVQHRPGSQSGWYNYHQGEFADFFVGCKEVVQVDDGDADSVVAYTDRLLNPTNSYKLNGEVADSPQPEYGPDPGYSYSAETKVEYFGKSISSDQINSETDPSPPAVLACEGEDPNNSSLYASVPPSIGNSCADFELRGNASEPEARGFAYWNFEYRLSENGYQEYYWWASQVFSAVLDVGVGGGTAHPAANFFAVGYGGLQFFDGIFNGSNYVSSQSSGSMETEISTSDTLLLDWDIRDYGQPPTVWAIDSQKCYGAFCEEGEENELTLNGQNGGDQEGDGGFFRATMQFFAAADKNQLPIRRIIVDWGDGKQDGSESADNYYKNHRGLEEGSQTTSICERCDDGGSDCEWGMNENSCDPNYFTYQHNYRCTASDVYQMRVDGKFCDFTSDLTDPCTDGTACYYQPKVHVRDNWGWCTGVCTEIGDDGCFDSVSALDNPIESNSECSYGYYPNAGTTSINPWVYYSGVIRVEP